MIVLGVDPGSLSTGYGVVEGAGGRYKALSYGAIRNTSKTAHPERLRVIQCKILEVIREFNPSFLALEGVFVSKNARSALILGQVRGVVMVTAVSEGLEVREFSPAEVKIGVTGYGRAEKGQVQKMVQTLLGLSEIPKPNDAADAVAIALCALARAGWDSKVSQSHNG